MNVLTSKVSANHKHTSLDRLLNIESEREKQINSDKRENLLHIFAMLLVFLKKVSLHFLRKVTVTRTIVPKLLELSDDNWFIIILLYFHEKQQKEVFFLGVHFFYSFF